MKSKFNWREAIITTLAVLMLILFMAAVSYETAAASEVDVDPTAVLVYDPSTGESVLMHNVPILNGTKYLFCVADFGEWPVVRCLRPKAKRSTKYGAEIFSGTWELTMAVTTGRAM